MPRGSKPGERRGGRQKGSLNKKTLLQQKAVEATGVTPLDFMIQIMRDPKSTPEMKLDAAAKAAPYVHPKLAAYDVNATVAGDLTVEIVDFSKEEVIEETGE
jgi:hypothetical protein